MERIISIKEVENVKLSEKDWNSFDGFAVLTDKHSYFFGISNGQSCCENWGYFVTNDSIEDFFNAELLSVGVVDTCLETTKNPETYDGNVMFMNFETSHGTLQFTAYNAHNGYYGHAAVYVVDGELVNEEYL